MVVIIDAANDGIPVLLDVRVKIHLVVYALTYLLYIHISTPETIITHKKALDDRESHREQKTTKGGKPTSGKTFYRFNGLRR
jgi:hypothetical protein